MKKNLKFKDLFTENMEPNWEFIETISEFKKLSQTKQSTVWHQEGDVLTHTKLVTQQMHEQLSLIDGLTDDYKLMMLSAAICHDLGKGCTTKWDEEKKDWACKRHGQASARIIRTLFYHDDIDLREKVCYMARHHMTLHHIFDKPERTNKALIRMSCGMVTVHDMNILNWCDSMGSKNEMESEETANDRFSKVAATAMDLKCYRERYPDFRNDWHMIEFFRGQDYQMPDEVIVPAESYEPRLNIIVMIGVPGSGKDYYFENECKPLGMKMLSRDVIRTEIGLTGEKPQGTKEQEQEVTRIFDERMIEYCKKGESFVINNTNVRKEYRSSYLDKCMPYFPRIIYVYCESPDLKVNKERRRRMMPERIIDRMWNDFEFPEPVEYSDGIIAKQKDEND